MTRNCVPSQNCVPTLNLWETNELLLCCSYVVATCCIESHLYYFEGEEDSSVTMEVDEDMITAAIETKGDTYHLEVCTTVCEQ